MTWCWIIPIIVGLITALLGYLLGRSGKQKEVREWQNKYNQERENLIAIQRKISLYESDLTKAQESAQEATKSYNELKGRFDLLQREWDKNRTEIQNLKAENKQIAAQLADCEKRSGQPEQKDNGGTSQDQSSDQQTKDSTKMTSDKLSSSKPPKLVYEAAVARAVFGKSIKENDLTIVEGIGPKIQELFHQNGIHTWYQLSQCSIERCQEVLNSGGPRFQQHKPGTWPQQALLAFQGKWEELMKWQDELEGGT